jgi:hypothetical protein
MSTSTSTYRSIVIRPGQAPSHEARARPALSRVTHILWLSHALLIDVAALGAELDSAAHPPSGQGFSAGSGSLIGAPAAIIQIFEASAAEIHTAAEKAKSLHPGCLSMVFDAAEGFDLDAAARATLDAMGLASSIPEATASGESSKRI